MTREAVRLVDAPWLRQGPLPQLMAILNCDGEEARAVGGAVRNALLGEPVHEIDVATTARPEEVARRAKAAGFKVVPTGIEHGTVTVVIDGLPFEITTLRQDVETFGRRANVVFGRDWQADAKRRDFTFNALSVSADGTVHDYVGGLDDLSKRRVRFIGEARRRIVEDYLRILRFFRFHAAYGHGEPDREAILACIAERHGLSRLSRERLRAEMLKLLGARGAVPALTAMSDAGLLTEVLGGIAQLASLEAVTEIEGALGLDTDPVRRLGALAVMIAEDAARLRDRLRLTKAEYERLTAMGDHGRRCSPGHMPAARGWLYTLGPERFTDSVVVAWSRSGAGAGDGDWRDLATLAERWPAPTFPLKAADFTRRGVARGPALGAALRAAERAWIAADFPLDAGELDRIADAAAGAA